MFEFGKLEALYRDTISVKHKERVEKYGEVFTPENIVKDMLNLIPEPETIERTYLEPSCGDGNFLVEILNRKLALCSSFKDVLIAVGSIYAIDIQADNVLEARRRMLGVVFNSFTLNDVQLSQLNEILYKNIVLGNMIEDRMLKLDNEGYLLDFHSNERKMLLVVGENRFDTSVLLEDTNKVYFASDIRSWYENNGLSITSDECTGLAHYLKTTKFHNRIVFYEWIVENDCKLSGKAEFLYDEEEDSSKVAEPILTGVTPDFFNGLNLSFS